MNLTYIVASGRTSAQTGPNSFICCFERKTGLQAWFSPVENCSGLVALRDGQLLMATASGGLKVYQPELTTKHEMSKSLDPPEKSSALSVLLASAISSQTLICGYDNGDVHMWKLTNMEYLTSFNCWSKMNDLGLLDESRQTKRKV
jgi:hypothetical protein